MKYKLFRSLGSIDRDVKKHELVAVEYGRDIYDRCPDQSGFGRPCRNTGI